jgi:hypothetical protein
MTKGLVIVFLLALTSSLTYGLITLQLDGLPQWIQANKLIMQCVLVGGLGGTVYCLRGVYLNASVRKQWDNAWLPWYFSRPFVSATCGGISYLFLKAGLLVLESSTKQDATDLGFLVLAFIAGLNVDKFISKVEDIAQATYGIEKSRTAKESDQTSNEK